MGFEEMGTRALGSGFMELVGGFYKFYSLSGPKHMQWEHMHQTVYQTTQTSGISREWRGSAAVGLLCKILKLSSVRSHEVLCY